VYHESNQLTQLGNLLHLDRTYSRGGRLAAGQFSANLVKRASWNVLTDFILLIETGLIELVDLLSIVISSLLRCLLLLF
jgi:hypothetical protein